jgi:hypothetical protein
MTITAFDTESQTKRCSTCGERKPLSEFYSHARLAGGVSNACKVCDRERPAARQRALSRLAERHAGEYKALLRAEQRGSRRGVVLCAAHAKQHMAGESPVGPCQPSASWIGGFGQTVVCEAADAAGRREEQTT